MLLYHHLQGTDQSMLEKLHRQHTTNANYVKPKSSQVRAFGIVHFAGVVYYSASGFLEKNRDTFSNDLFDLLATTKSTFLRDLFKNERAMVSQIYVHVCVCMCAYVPQKYTHCFMSFLHNRLWRHARSPQPSVSSSGSLSRHS